MATKKPELKVPNLVRGNLYWYVNRGHYYPNLEDYMLVMLLDYKVIDMPNYSAGGISCSFLYKNSVQNIILLNYSALTKFALIPIKNGNLNPNKLFEK